MLRAVVAENAVDVLLPGAEDKIGQKDGYLHHALDEVVEGGALGMEQSGNKCGQQHEQHQRQAEAEDDGERHDQGLQLRGGDVLFQPPVQLAGLGVLLVGKVVCGEHQRLDAGDHGAEKGDGAAEDGDPQNGVFVLDESPLRHLGDQSLRRADHDGVLLRSAHENAFDQRLSADGGAERALFLFHIPE